MNHLRDRLDIGDDGGYLLAYQSVRTF